MSVDKRDGKRDNSNKQERLLHISNEAACFIRKVWGLKNDAVIDSGENIILRTIMVIVWPVCGIAL